MSVLNKADSNTELPPPLALTLMATGYMVSQAIYVAAKLGIADLVADSPKSSSELAATLGANASALYRLLRTLVSRGVFREDPPGHFGQSPLSAFLRSDDPGSLRAPVILWNEEQYRAWGDLLEAVKTGQTPFDRMFGSAWFDYYIQGGSEKAEIFNAAMTGWTSRIGAAVARAYDFSRFGTVVDVGGGHGILLACILSAFPGIRGVVLDTDTVVQGARRRIEDSGLSQRCSAVTADFFRSIPRGGDAYILAQVLHDWSDPQCVAILRNCHAAMSDEGRILVVETVIIPGQDSSLATLADLHMLVVTGGRERTEGEYADLLSQAGFKLTRVVPTQSPAQIVEGVPL